MQSVLYVLSYSSMKSKQKGFINTVTLFIIIAALVGVGAYFVSTRQDVSGPSPISVTTSPEPTALGTQTPKPNPTHIGQPIPVPNPQNPNPQNIVSTCNGVSNTLKGELDQQPFESLKLVTGGSDIPETINGGSSFDSQFVFNTANNQIEHDIFVGGLRLSPGRQIPQQDARADYQPDKASFHIEYREYDRSTTPYTYKIGFIPQTITGWIETRSVAVNPYDHVCGSFDITGTGTYGIGAGTHTIHVSGTFNQTLPPLRPGPGVRH